MIKSVTQHSYFQKKPNKQMGRLHNNPSIGMGAPKIYTCPDFITTHQLDGCTQNLHMPRPQNNPPIGLVQIYTCQDFRTTHQLDGCTQNLHMRRLRTTHQLDGCTQNLHMHVHQLGTISLKKEKKKEKKAHNLVVDIEEKRNGEKVRNKGKRRKGDTHKR